MYFQTIKLVLKKIKDIQNVTMRIVIRIVTCLKYRNAYCEKNSVSLHPYILLNSRTTPHDQNRDIFFYSLFLD